MSANLPNDSRLTTARDVLDTWRDRSGEHGPDYACGYLSAALESVLAYVDETAALTALGADVAERLRDLAVDVDGGDVVTVDREGLRVTVETADANAAAET